MAFEILQTPARKLSITSFSRWGAAFNPQVFEYQRKDFEVVTIDDSGGGELTILINQEVSDEDAEKIVGTYVYVKTADYDYLALVTAQSTPASALVLTVVSDGQTVTNNGGFVNIPALFPAYKFRTTIKIAGEEVVARHTPNVKGFCRVDIQTYLKVFTSNVDNLDYNYLSTIDRNRFVSYQTVIAEELDRNTTGEVKSPSTIYYSVHSALNFNELGSNMGYYTAFVNELNDTKKAKFLTDAAQPIMTTGLPFDLSFIVDDSLVGKQLYCRYATLDINKNNIVGGLTPSVIYASAGNPVAASPTGLLLSSNNIASGFSITAEVGVNRLVLLDNLLSTVKFVQVYIYFIDGATEKRITEIKTIEVQHGCLSATGFIYLKWLNTKGGFDYGLFDNRNEYALEVSAQTYVDRVILDYSTQNTTQDVLSKFAQQKITVGKNTVTKDEMNLLSGVLYSNKVYMLSNPNPRQWQTVIVDDKGTVLFDTKHNRGDFQTAIKLPDLNIQTA